MNHASDTRATTWRLRTRSLDMADAPLLMGIVNVTPDSFSDGGRYATVDRAVAHAIGLVDAGADLLDIGGESTRPYSTPVTEEEESKRIEPVVREVCRRVNVPVSIDTSKASVARIALDLGAEIINDITGLAGDPNMLPLARSTQAGVCVMHMLGTPETMQDQPRYENVVQEIFTWLAHRRDTLIKAGMDREKICLDPGVGFGKTHEHNLTLMQASAQFLSLGCPLLVGHSRKGFIGHVLGDSSIDRAAGSVGAALWLASQGVHVIRVHDVQAVSQALRLYQACRDATACLPRLDEPR